jgi:Raf kinase inhibitor-like YbhB/YbcL family protein
MQRLTTAILAAALVVPGVASTTTAAEQEPGESTIEIPGSGASLTLPAQWRLWSTPGAEGLLRATDFNLRQMCHAFLVSGVNTPTAVADEYWSEARPDVEILERVDLDLPAADAVHVNWAYANAPNGFFDYYVAVPLGVAEISCYGLTEPEDGWRSVIESIAPVPVDGLPTTTFDPRVAVPDPGFAIDFPVEWMVQPWPSVEPSPILDGEVVLRALSPIGEGRPESYECWIEDGTGSSELSDPDAVQRRLQARLETASLDQEIEVGDIPSRPANRVDGTWNGQPASGWPLTEGELRLALVCRADVPPGDRWLSVAETFGALSQVTEEAGMRLTSSAFEHEDLIPTRFTCDGRDISPPLELHELPADAVSLVLVMDDPDAPGGTWDHWVAYDIPPRSEIPKAVESLGTPAANSWGDATYGGPCPPSGTHRYFFVVYALDTELGLEPAANKATVLEAMEGHVMAEATLMGRYERP